VALAFTGFVLMTAPGAGGSSSGSRLGDLLTLGCALAFTGHIIFQDRVSAKAGSSHFKQLALLQLGFCTLVMLLTTPLLERPHIYFTPLVIVALAVESILATAVAFTVQSWVQQFLAPTYLVLIYAMEPVFAWLTSLLFLHQGLSVRAGAGALLILIGMLTA
jgi:drug/metabolite transporter (DMT)-like permease